MSTSLAKKVLDHVGFQVKTVFTGLEEAQWSHRIHPESMTPFEMITHLTECCRAAAYRISRDEEFPDWGKTQMSGSTPDEWMEEFHATRSQAISAGLEKADEKSLDTLMDLLALHEAYHVGQMCTLRLDLDPKWNPLSIYGM